MSKLRLCTRSLLCPLCCLALPPPSRVALCPATSGLLREPGCCWSPSWLCPILPHPIQGSSSFTCPSCACLAHIPVVSGDPSIPHPQNLLSSASLLVPFAFVGRKDTSGGQASNLGATRRRWIMCLFFNSTKKPTSKIPFLFFLDLGIQLPALY